MSWWICGRTSAFPFLAECDDVRCCFTLVCSSQTTVLLTHAWVCSCACECFSVLWWHQSGERRWLRHKMVKLENRVNSGREEKHPRGRRSRFIVVLNVQNPICDLFWECKQTGTKLQPEKLDINTHRHTHTLIIHVRKLPFRLLSWRIQIHSGLK